MTVRKTKGGTRSGAVKTPTIVPTRTPTIVPTRTKALNLIGGTAALDSLHATSVAVAKKSSFNRLQLAMAITGRHFACATQEDLAAPATASKNINDRTHMAFDLNKEDGPWAVAMSGDAYAWATVSADDLSTLETVQAFLNCVFGHLR